MKRVLVLGAGLVARPLVRYLLDRAGFEVTVASRTAERADQLIDGHPRGAHLSFDIEKDDKLHQLVSGHDLTVSLLPYVHHIKVAEAVISAGKHLVTTSYVSPGMRELHTRARDAGCVLLNEIGLDPGIDHMEAMRVIDDVKEKGGKVDGFISYCGGLPAPEANDNPWGYKFSWSPRGVVLASRNSARFRKGGNIVEVPGRELFANYEMIDIEGLGSFEGYPNRDSVPYADIYGIPDARTVLRGTLRNRGWCDTWKGLHDIGLLDEGPVKARTYLELMKGLAPGRGSLRKRLEGRIRTRGNELAVSNWEWLGLLSDEKIPEGANRIDALSSLLEKRLVYKEGERDMIVLQHTFEAELPEGKALRRSTLIDFGINWGDSAMSRTVGLPAAIGAEMILKGKLKGASGVLIPTMPDLYIPILDKLKAEGIAFKEG